MSTTKYPDYIPSQDIPSLTNKVLLITGGTAGLGHQTILTLAPHNPSRILFTGRNTSAAKSVIESTKALNPKIDISFIQCDFTSLPSVKSAAQKVLAENDRLDILMCNAGVMAIPKGLTKDGYENQMGTNHLAHAMLIKTLLPLLLTTSKLPGSDVRIISSTSLGFQFARTISFPELKTERDMFFLGAFQRYGESKLANILYAQQLAKRYPGITSVAVHPGIVHTGLVTGLKWGLRWFTYLTTIGRTIGLEDGVKNQVWAATVPKEKGMLENGGFYIPVGQVGPVTRASGDKELAEKLWEWTEGELKKF